MKKDKYIDETSMLIQRLQCQHIVYERKNNNKDVFSIFIDIPKKEEVNLIYELLKNINNIQLIAQKNNNFADIRDLKVMLIEESSLINILNQIDMHLYLNSDFNKSFFSSYGISYNPYINSGLNLYEIYTRLLNDDIGIKAVSEFLGINKSQLTEMNTEEVFFSIYQDSLSKNDLFNLIRSNKKNLELSHELFMFFIKYRDFYDRFVRLKLIMLKNTPLKTDVNNNNNIYKDNNVENSFLKVLES